METFRIRATSRVIFILTFLLAVFAGSAVGIALLHTKENTAVAIALAITVVGGAFYATRFTARALTQWTITDEEIRVRWLSQFILHNKPDLAFRWQDIRDYNYRRGKNFDLFRIRLSDGTVVQLGHNTGTTGDDFARFVGAFESRARAYHDPERIPTNDTRRAGTFYETKTGSAVAIVAVICLVALPVLIAVLPFPSGLNWGGLGGAYAGGLFYLIRFFKYRNLQRGN